MNLAFKYVQQHGISTESSYPYTASGGRSGTCKTGTDSGVKVTGYTIVRNDETDLQSAVGKSKSSLTRFSDYFRYKLFGMNTFF